MGEQVLKIVLEILVFIQVCILIFVDCVTYDMWCLETLVLRNVHTWENFWKTFTIFQNLLIRSNFIRGITVPNLALFPLNVFNLLSLYEYITRITLGHRVVDWLLVRADVSNSSNPFCLLVIYDVLRHSVLLGVARLWLNFQHNSSTSVVDGTAPLPSNEIMKNLDLSI